MTRSYFKNIIRTIKMSLGRYLALICIVMLGVVFFVGLKITTEDMTDSGNAYFEETNFYDYCLISGAGFDNDTINYIKENTAVFNVEGSYFRDYIIDTDGVENKVARIHGITKNVNRLVIKEGREPINSNECVVDSRYFDSNIIGKKIKITDENTDEAKSELLYDEFVVCGIADSPLYISYQRGTCNIGNGNISCFIFIDPNAFTVDYYSQLFVDSENGYLTYSDRYDDYLEENKPVFEKVLNDCLEIRMENISYKAAQKSTEFGTAEGLYQASLVEYAELESEFNEILDELEDLNAKLLDAEREENIHKVRYMNSYAYLDDEQKAEYQKNMDDAVEYADSVRERVSSLQEYSDSCKEILENIKNELEKTGSELEDARNRLNVEVPENPQLQLLTRKDNQGCSEYKSNAEIVESIALIFPVFFVIVAALVCVTTMSRMIAEERTQIGVLKALGYGRCSILIKYILYSLSALLAGCFLGFYIGSILFPYVIWKAYMLMYTYTDRISMIFEYKYLLMCIIVSAIVILGSTVLTVVSVVRENAAEMIRPRAPEPGKRILLEKITPFWSKLSFMQKISLRNCFRYKKRFFMMMFGIAGCTALLIIGFGIRDSISGICNLQYGEIEKYDYQISISSDISVDKKAEIEESIKELNLKCIGITRKAVDISAHDNTKNAILVACNDYDGIRNSISFNTDNGKQEPDGKSGCMISENLADSLKIKTGDIISIKYENLNVAEYEVTAVFENYINNYIFVTDGAYELSGEEFGVNCFYASNTAERIEGTTARLSDIENVINVTDLEVTRNYFNKMVKSLNVIVYLVICCAAVLAFVVLYNLNNINIMERTREIATIKVLGFGRKETASYVFRENLILTVMGAGLGMPLGKLMHFLVMDKIRVDMICFDIHIEFFSYVISVMITLFFSICVNMFMRRKTDEINMSESLKAIE